MKKLAILFILILIVLKSGAQKETFNKSINKDSLFEVVVKKLPKGIQKEYTKLYKNGNEQEKEFLLFMLCMPRSSKEELIDNFEKKKAEIFKLKEEYLKLVPANYLVEIEFEPENIVINQPKSITLKIYKQKIQNETTSKSDSNEVERNDGLEVVSQNWNMAYDSDTLHYLIKTLGWDMQTIIQIKKYLDAANCISIENNTYVTIGYARSGMGKYSYNIHDSKLTEKEIAGLKETCTHIFYKDNVVLEYGGGAIGPQCFEKE